MRSGTFASSSLKTEVFLIFSQQRTYSVRCGNIGAGASACLGLGRMVSLACGLRRRWGAPSNKALPPAGVAPHSGTRFHLIGQSFLSSVLQKNDQSVQMHKRVKAAAKYWRIHTKFSSSHILVSRNEFSREIYSEIVIIPDVKSRLEN